MQTSPTHLSRELKGPCRAPTILRTLSYITDFPRTSSLSICSILLVQFRQLIIILRAEGANSVVQANLEFYDRHTNLVATLVTQSYTLSWNPRASVPILDGLVFFDDLAKCFVAQGYSTVSDSRFRQRNSLRSEPRVQQSSSRTACT